MAKFNLITGPTSNYLYLTSVWVQDLYSEYFDITPYDPGRTYNPNDTAVLIDYADQLERPEWYQQMKNKGFRIVVEHLGDSDVERLSHTNNDVLTLRNPNWMWYNACLEWSWYGLDQYKPTRNYQYSFLMPMNLPRWHRDQAMTDLAPLLPTALYSYCDQGIELPGTPPLHIPWRGYMNPEWYDHTPYSVVSESYMRSTAVNEGLTYRTEVSEKIFKPMLGQQPFIVYGSVDTLKYLHREGFVTYDNLFDESYDVILDNKERFRQVTQLVYSSVQAYPYQTFRLDQQTLERIAHNHARLFDLTLVQQRFRAEVVGDILAWWES